MPIAVDCPKCEASLSAPDSAAGKKIRCPECQAVVPVPDEEAEAPRPRRKKRPSEIEDEDDRPRKRKKPARPDTDVEEDDRDNRDEEEDDEDDRPGPRGNPTIPMPVWIAYGICVLAVIVGILGSVYIVKDAREREADAKRNKDQPGVGIPGDTGGVPLDPPQDAGAAMP